MNKLYILGENNPAGIGPSCSLLRINEKNKPVRNIMYDCGFAINVKNNTHNAKTLNELEKKFNETLKINNLPEKLKISIEVALKAFEESDLELTSSLIPPNLKLLHDMGVKIDAVVGSHAHFDHLMAVILTLIGLKKGNEVIFDKLLKDDAYIWGAPPTLKLLSLQINDDLIGNKSKFNIGLFDLFELEKRYRKLTLGENEILPGQKIFVFHPGHIHGSVSIIVKLPNGENAGFISDTSFRDRILISGADKITDVVPPEWLPHYILNTDLTYSRKDEGEKDYDYNKEFEKFKSVVVKTIARGGKVLIPAFRILRGQTVAVGLAPLLKELGIPLYSDGGIRKVFDTLLELQKEPWSDKEKNFNLDGIKMVRNYDRKTGYDERQELIDSESPMIITSTSGMCNHGPVRGKWLNHFLEDEKSTIILVGYQANNTIGGELLNLSQNNRKNKNIYLDGKEKEVKCEIQGIGLSDHSPLEIFPEKYYEPIVRARNGQKMKLCVLTHGEEKNKETAMKEYKPYFEKIIIAKTAKNPNGAIIF